jgi:hypothetical protein
MAAVEQLLSIGIQLVAHLADFSQRNGWLIRTTEDSIKRKILLGTPRHGLYSLLQKFALTTS